MTRPYDVAAYVWPSYTRDEPRARVFWPEGGGEWETVRKAVIKAPGDPEPRQPVWGYVNESDPRVMELQIDAAAEHGINVFIYDWYWYDNRPFLEACVDGFCAARNNDRMRFYLMWANHDATTIWDIRLSDGPGTVLWEGSVDRAGFEEVADRIIERYFSHPSYYRIDDRPVFAIYDLGNLMRGLGGPSETREALAWFRRRVVERGFAGLHLQVVLWNSRHLTNFDGSPAELGPELVASLGFDSATHYQFVHMADVDRDYPAVLEDVKAEWQRWSGLAIPYFPHVSVGWDNNPRFHERRTPILTETTPENLEAALRAARDYADAHPDQQPLIVVNSWNEWTESSHLQPDDIDGYGRLEAVRRVFGQDGG